MTGAMATGLDKPLGLGIMLSVHDLGSDVVKKFGMTFGNFAGRITSMAKRIGGSLLQLGKGFLIFKSGQALLSGGFSLANQAGVFEQKLAAVGAVTRATAQDMKSLHGSAIQAGIATQFSPTEAVEGLTSLATAGQTARQSVQTLVPVLDLAAGSLGQLGVAESAEAVVGTLNAYGMAAGKAGGVTDKLLRITQLSNFQARDFSIGLSKAAAMGATFKQSLDDVLITMGLLRNRNIDASSSATAFREATRRLGADQRSQKAVIGAHVRLFDKYTGKMRSIVDVMSDFAKATDDMTEKERNRRVARAFGARGLLAFNAIQTASYTAMKNGTQVTYQGAAAISEMRKQMKSATGTAAEFRKKLLDTFEGQKTLLKGTVQTLGVVFGEPFAAVFKPLVSVVVNVLNAVIRAFQAMPKPIKVAFAGFISLAGVIIALGGAAIFAKGAFALLGMAGAALGISLGGILASMLPVLAVIAAVSAAIIGFYQLYKRNIGGFGDYIDAIGKKISLAWKGLGQMFDKGQLSGSIARELDRAENSGLKAFVVNVWQFAKKTGEALGGFKDGFVSMLVTLKPVFVEFVEALMSIGNQVFGLFGDMAEGFSFMPHEGLTGFFHAVGSILAWVVGLFIQVATVVARFVGGIMSGFRDLKGFLAPAFGMAADAIGKLIGEIGKLLGFTDTAADSLNGTVSGFGLAFKGIGTLIGWVAGALSGVIGLAVYTVTILLRILIAIASYIKFVVSSIVDGILFVGQKIGEFSGYIVLLVTEKIPNAFRFLAAIVSFVLLKIANYFVGFYLRLKIQLATIVKGVISYFSPLMTFFERIRDGIRKVIRSIADIALNLLSRIPNVLLPESLIRLKHSGFVSDQSVEKTFVRSERAGSPMPAAAEATRRSDDIGQLRTDLAELARAQSKQSEKDINIKLEVDGETLSRATHKAGQEAAGREFSPVANL